MKLALYRTHDAGPLTTITVMPGAVCVEMRFEQIHEHTRLHSHTFDHWMECVEGSAMIVLGSERRNVNKGERYLVEAHQRHGVWPSGPWPRSTACGCTSTARTSWSRAPT